MSVLDIVRRHRLQESDQWQKPPIGADFIPRARPDDPRYTGVDLDARGRDFAAIRIGLGRLTVTMDDLSMELRATVDRIAQELRIAGAEEIGRWATDLLYAYSEGGKFPESIQLVAYQSWRCALQPSRDDPGSEPIA